MAGTHGELVIAARPAAAIASTELTCQYVIHRMALGSKGPSMVPNPRLWTACMYKCGLREGWLRGWSARQGGKKTRRRRSCRLHVLAVLL